MWKSFNRRLGSVDVIANLDIGARWVDGGDWQTLLAIPGEDCDMCTGHQLYFS